MNMKLGGLIVTGVMFLSGCEKLAQVDMATAEITAIKADVEALKKDNELLRSGISAVEGKIPSTIDRDTVYLSTTGTGYQRLSTNVTPLLVSFSTDPAPQYWTPG